MLPSLFPLLAILVLLVVAILLVVIRLSQPGFAYSWIIAALGSLLAWTLVFFSRLNIDQTILLVTWRPEEYFPISPTLLVDRISWSFAMALVTLALSVILTGAARDSEADWSAWTGILSLTAIGVMAVMAGNLLTLVLAWAALDLTELLILLWQTEGGARSERLVVSFSIRAGGIWLLLLGATLAGLFEFNSIPQQVSVFLLLAAGLRLGALPLNVPFLKKLPWRRGLGTILRLVPASASLVLLSRTAFIGVPNSLTPFLLLFSGIIAIYAGFSWICARDELDGSPYWILGMAAFTMVVTIRGQSEASLAWGIATIFSGGLLFLYSARNRYLLPLIGLGLLGFSGLAFTPMWSGMQLYSAPMSPFLLILIVPHAMLMVGYLWHALRPGQTLSGVERWVWIVYPWGLSLLPLAHFLFGGWGLYNGIQSEWPSRLSMVLPSIVTILVAGLMFTGLRRGLSIPEGVQSVFDSVFSLRWLYRFIQSGFRALGSVFAFLSTVLEGEGGVLWALLLLILLLVFLAKGGLGGV